LQDFNKVTSVGGGIPDTEKIVQESLVAEAPIAEPRLEGHRYHRGWCFRE